MRQGFFCHSLLEKPAWSLLRNSDNSAVPEQTVRDVHSSLSSVITHLPPIMITTQSLGAILIATQMWMLNFSSNAVLLAILYAVGMSSIIVQLFSRINAVKSVPSNAEIAKVREGLRGLLIIHHLGLLVAVMTQLLELILMVPLLVA